MKIFMAPPRFQSLYVPHTQFLRRYSSVHRRLLLRWLRHPHHRNNQLVVFTLFLSIAVHKDFSLALDRVIKTEPANDGYPEPLRTQARIPSAPVQVKQEPPAETGKASVS
jgi:hypothetical protein